ncbi:MAG: hypothetical protein D4R65_11715 [Verrucomicrobiaceae bacterium]|nr:MAG: hypothetical protein D4R65_11715 [Verrucomicrobiaceae bacterium]
MSFSVLNPGGRDSDQVFPDGPGKPDDPGHPPVNYHAYAACRKGGFYRDEKSVPAGTVLVLLRKRNLRSALASIATLRKRSCKIFVSCKESGSHQVADLLGDVSRWELFQEVCGASDGAISSTPELVTIYRAAGCPAAEFLPTPYPVDFPAWDFSQPLEKRRGIFVGTREFAVPSRNHLAAVVMADQISRDLSCPLAVVNVEGRSGGMILKSLRKKNPLLYIIEAPLPYPDYLKVMALHRIVWQLDASSVPGQVAGDALLCRMPCIGGNGAIERIAFGEFASAGRDELAARARDLLQNDEAWRAVVHRAGVVAGEALSFRAVSDLLPG